jgi:hypothetical protein
VGNSERRRHQHYYGENARPNAGFAHTGCGNRTTSLAPRCLKPRRGGDGLSFDCSSTAPSPSPQRAQAEPPKTPSGKGSETRERLRLLASHVPLIKIAAFVETEAAEPGPCLSYSFKHRKPKKVTANLAAFRLPPTWTVKYVTLQTRNKLRTKLRPRPKIQNSFEAAVIENGCDEIPLLGICGRWGPAGTPSFMDAETSARPPAVPMADIQI